MKFKLREGLLPALVETFHFTISGPELAHISTLCPIPDVIESQCSRHDKCPAAFLPRRFMLFINTSIKWNDRKKPSSDYAVSPRALHALHALDPSLHGQARGCAQVNNTY